jgi:hypothetical protein
LSQFLRLSSAFCAASCDPKYATDALFPRESVNHSWLIHASTTFEF